MVCALVSNATSIAPRRLIRVMRVLQGDDLRQAGLTSLRSWADGRCRTEPVDDPWTTPSMMSIATLARLTVLVLAACIGTTRAADSVPLTVETRIPLGDVSGRIDHLAFDPARKRLYVAELGNNSVGVVDLKAGRLLQTVRGLDEPQGIGYEPGTDTIYVADGGDGTVRLFSGADFKPLGAIPLGTDADNVRVDPAAHRVYVGYGEGAIAVIDPVTRQRIADIPLAGHPESFQLEPDGHRIFVNVPGAGHIAIASRDTKSSPVQW